MPPLVVPAPDALLRVGRKEVPARSSPKVSTVLHIEDERLWREFTASLLNEWPEACYAGSAGNGLDGIAHCREKRPAIVLLDLGLPDIDGFTVLDELNALPHPPRVLLLTGRMNDALLYRVILGDIAGLIPKSGDFDQHLRPALAVVLAGKKYFPPEVVEAARQLRHSPDAFFKILSPIERQMLCRAGTGCPDGQIARCTGRCASTVRVHIHHIMAKLGLKHRPELQRWALAKGLLTGCDRRSCEAWGKMPKWGGLGQTPRHLPDPGKRS